MPLPVLDDSRAIQAFSSACVLCGQKLGHAKSVLQHLQRDHAQMLDQATTAHADLLQYMIIPSMLLHLCETTGRPQMPSALSSPDLEAPELLQAYWHDSELRATLTQQRRQCQTPLNAHELLEHLQSHPDFMDRALPLLPRIAATSSGDGGSVHHLPTGGPGGSSPDVLQEIGKWKEMAQKSTNRSRCTLRKTATFERAPATL